MDSLTQMVLGAAVGEALLGKKIGNRAMVWGAIGGTIPDLDILAYSFMNPIDALAVHRGLSHSIFFGILFPWVIALLPNWIYGHYWHKKSGYRWLVTVLALLFLSAFGYVIMSIVSSVFGFSDVLKWSLVVVVFVGILYGLLKKYTFTTPSDIEVTYIDWVKLFVGAILTHPLLDAFTPYGTQLFQPFSDYRVAFNTISIVDPLYTVPFIICLLIASRFASNSIKRIRWNRLGLLLSSSYLLWSVFIHQHVVDIVQNSQDIQLEKADRFMTTPTILNTLLWNIISEYPEYYTLSYYSLFDKTKKPSNVIKVKKNHDLLAKYDGNKDYKILKWFSNNYYNLEERDEGVVFHDLRYTSRNKNWDKPHYIFGFDIKPVGDRLMIEETRDRPDDGQHLIKSLWSRIKGSRMTDDH